MNGLNADIRIFKRIIAETVKGIQRTRWMNLIIIVTLAAILSIFGCLFRTGLAVSEFVDYLGNSAEISAYIKNGYNAEKAKIDILKLDGIQEITLIPKEKAWEDFKKETNVPDIENPLPDTLRIKVNDREKIEGIITDIKKLPSIEDIQYSKHIVDKILKISKVTDITSLILLTVLAGLTLSIINNTIQLVIRSKSDEIEIMRMMGAGNNYIRAPYLLQGAFYGFCGAVISVIPLIILEKYLHSAFAFFNIGISQTYTPFIIIILTGTGVFVGSLGSLIAVRKYLKI